MALLLFLGGVAQSQTFDAHGPALPPDGPSVRDPLLGFGGTAATAPVLGLTGEAANALLVREVVDGTVDLSEPVVDDLFGVGVDATFPLGERLAFGVTVPVWLASGGEAGGGLAPGDAHAWLPVRVIARERVRLAVVPFVRAGTGADARYLGDPGPGGVGALASLGVDRGPFVAALEAGADAGLATGEEDWPGGVHGRFATAVGVAAGSSFGLLAEWRGRAPLLRPLPGVPSEALLTAKIRPESAFWLTAGAGTAVTRGIGAAGLRMEVGAHGAFGGEDGLGGTLLAAAAGAPELHVIDERRWPIGGAVAVVASAEVTTDPDGYCSLPPRTLRVGRFEVRADGYEPVVVDAFAPDQASWEVVLRRVPVSVTVQAVGPEGALDDVAVAVYGPEEVPPPTVDAAGARRFELRPGTWNVKVGSPGMGSQERTVEIAFDRTEPVRVDAVLAPEVDPETTLVVEVVDRHGVPVEDAVVAIQDRDFGTTGTGGDLVVHGVAPGETAVLVRSSTRAEATVVETQVLPDETNTVRAVLEWPPGSVLVRVSRPDGRPVDARVAFAGPASLPSRSVGSDGEELLVLRPGPWDLLVSSEDFGAQERHVDVSDRPGEVAELVFVLRPIERGTAELEVAVSDPDGLPVADAELVLDGEPLGRTGPDGRAVLLGLDPGERELEVAGDLLAPVVVPVDLLAGRQVEHVAVGYVTGVVDLRVWDLASEPLPAVVAFSGPEPVPPLEVDGDGHARGVLPPGPWQLAVSNEEFGLQVRDLVIAPGDPRLHRVSVTMLPVYDAMGKLVLTARDPTGAPVVGAKVSLDGVGVGTAANGRLEVGNLPLGPTTLGVRAEALAAATMEVEIVEVTPVLANLSWAAGAVEVRVKGPSGPVDALVMVSGPDAVSPRSAAGGTVRFGLSPGRWWVLASVPDLAVEEALVVVPAEPGLTVVELALEPLDEAVAVLSVRDEEGRPIAGVEAVIAGAEVGRSSEGGTVEISREGSGAVELVLEPPPGYEARTLPLSLERGEQERHVVVLERAATELAVKVGPDGAPVEATVTMSGQGEAAPVTATGGSAGVSLAPGTWTVTAEAASGVATAEVRVVPGATSAVELKLVPTGTTVADGRVRLAQPLLFDAGQHALRPEAASLLDDVARRLRADRTASLVEVQGHTSDEGGVVYNQGLSERRAAAVKAALVARGVPQERLVARGYGLTRPVTTARDEAARQLNRRVELLVVETAPR